MQNYYNSALEGINNLPEDSIFNKINAKEIIEEIKSRYNGTTIHRKAIGNIIKELIELEFNIEHSAY